MRARTLLAAAGLAALLAGSAPPRAAAGPHMPDLSIGLGGTGAVSGDLDSGGFAAWGTALWPVDGPWLLDKAG